MAKRQRSKLHVAANKIGLVSRAARTMSQLPSEKVSQVRLCGKEGVKKVGDSRKRVE